MVFARILTACAVALALPPCAAHAQQPSNAWKQLPRMKLERQFAGPLQDTVIQRWRDPVDGTVCYIYLPITAAHTPPAASGFVQYGANTIGTISCTVAATSSAKRKRTTTAPLPPKRHAKPAKQP